MATRTAPEALGRLLEGGSGFALIDIREAGEYNASHIPGTSPMPRRHLEFLMAQAVPFKGTPVVVCDDDGRRAELAAATLERMGYRHVSVLEGGYDLDALSYGALNTFRILLSEDDVEDPLGPAQEEEPPLDDILEQVGRLHALR